MFLFSRFAYLIPCEGPCDDDQTPGQSRTNRHLTARPGGEENEDVRVNLDADDDEPPSPTIPEKAALRVESLIDQITEEKAALEKLSAEVASARDEQRKLEDKIGDCHKAKQRYNGPDVGPRPAPQNHTLLELILDQPKMLLWLKIEKGDECTPQRVVDRLAEASEAYEKFQTQIEMLKNQIEGAGLKPVEEVTTLKEAEEKLQAAMAKVMKGDESANEDFEKWGAIVDSHPETKVKKENEDREWREQNERPNEEALRLMRSFIPSDIRSCSKAQLEARSVPEKIAKRVFDKKALWLCRMDPTFISKMHAADLCSKYAFQGLDLTEMRTVFASIPETFENDSDGKKKKYRMDLQQKLKDLTAKEANGGLTGNNLRNRVYSAQKTGPFDRDDAIVVETVSAGEKMEQKDAWLESKQRSSAGGLAKSGASGESKRAEDTSGEHTFNTDRKPPPKPRRPTEQQQSAHSGSTRSRPPPATTAGLDKARKKLMNSKLGALLRKSGQ